MPTSLVWIVNQGARFQRTLTYQDDDGNAIDLTGYSVRMQIRYQQSTSASLILDVQDEGYITISDAAAGEISIDIPDSATAAFAFSTAYWDVEIEDASGNVTRLLQGSMKLDREVTS